MGSGDFSFWLTDQLVSVWKGVPTAALPKRPVSDPRVVTCRLPTGCEAGAINASVVLDAGVGVSDRKSRWFQGRQAVSLKLDRSICLLRPLSPVDLPISELESMARADLELNTPVASGCKEVLFLADADGRIDHRHYVALKNTVLAAIAEQFAARGLTVHRIVAQSALGERRLHRSSLRHFRQPDRRAAAIDLLARISVATAVVGGMATFVHQQMQYQVAIAAVERDTAALEGDLRARRVELAAQRQQREKVAILLKRKAGGGTAFLPLLEELTRIMPDSSYLTDLRLESADGAGAASTATREDREIVIVGIARQAANLVPALENSPSFSAVRFVNPVVSVPGAALERFAISLRVRRGAT